MSTFFSLVHFVVGFYSGVSGDGLIYLCCLNNGTLIITIIRGGEQKSFLLKTEKCFLLLKTESFLLETEKCFLLKTENCFLLKTEN